MTQDCTLNFEVTTGVVDFKLNQTINFNQTLDILGTATTGGLNVDIRHASEIGLSLSAATSTGDIDVTGLANGITCNYALKDTHIDFDLETTPGGIDFSAVLI